MNWPFVFLMIIFILFIMSICIYNSNNMYKYIKDDWIDIKLLSVLYLLSFILFSLSVSESNEKFIFPLILLLLILQMLWCFSISLFYKFTYSMIFAALSFIICAIMMKLIETKLSFGLIPFLFFLLIQVAISINLIHYNIDY